MSGRRSAICMINGKTGESFTNEQILDLAVPLARALTARGARGRTIMLVMRNHEHLVALYYGALFAGAVLFLLDPQSTPHELLHFLALVEPSLVFCDADRVEEVRAAARAHALPPAAVTPHDALAQLAAAHSSLLDTFEVARGEATRAAVLLPTSGSTGLAKAGVLTHQGLIAQVPNLWTYHSEFPRPTATATAMFLSTAQWITFTNMLTSCPVYGVTILTSPDKSAQCAVQMLKKFRPTWMLQVPGFSRILAPMVQPHQVSSLRTILITGAPPSPDTLATWKSKLPAECHLCNSYGMTEIQGFAALPDRAAPLGSVGTLFNVLHYKLVDDDGQEVAGAEPTGELYLRSDYCVIKSYLKNEEAYQECVSPDGWWKTGDVFHADQQGYLFFVQRKKFWFKYMNYHISPEELENLINSVAGVQDCVVCGTEEGAAAAVVTSAGGDVSREQIHAVVNAAVMEHKRLRGGVAFVASLPRTHSGKLHRTECAALLARLLAAGECC